MDPSMFDDEFGVDLVSKPSLSSLSEPVIIPTKRSSKRTSHRISLNRHGDVELVSVRDFGQSALSVDQERGFGFGQSNPSLAEPVSLLVDWDGPDDPGNPKTWSRAFRWWITVLSSILTLAATLASSAPSAFIPVLQIDLGISEEIGSLLLSIFIVGYCLGPLAWGPLSESYGRRPVFIVSFILYTLSQVACALSPNTGALLAFRFLGGCFAAAPLSAAGAAIGDVWDADTRGIAIAWFTLAPIAGPALGPLASGYMAASGLSWKWIFWLLTCFAGACLLLVVFSLPETYAPIILEKRAQQLRKSTGNPGYYTMASQKQLKGMARISHILQRPWKVLFLEPALFAISIYCAFVYGCNYLLFEAFPIVFTIGYGLSEGTSGLMYLPFFCGGCSAVIVNIFVINPRYERLMEKFSPEPVPPEYRLEMAIVGGPLFAIGFFWFGWTSFTWIPFWSSMMAGSVIGAGVVLIYLSLFNYIMDTWLMVAASALAAITVVRSLFGAAFPLFATQMYDALDPRWASTLLGCVALIMVPIPLLLTMYGSSLRARSKFSPT